MPRECSVCRHRDRAAIDAVLVSGRSPRSIGAEFGLNHQAIERHRANHLPQAIRRAARAALEAHDAASEASDAANVPPIVLARPAPAQAASVTPSILPASSPPAGRVRRRGMELDPVVTPVSGATVAPPATPLPASSPMTPAGPLDLHEASLDLQRRALSILAQAEADGDLKTALTAIREARGVLEHLSRLEERTGATGHAAPLAQAPEWHRTRAAIVTALAPYPEARIAVAEAFVATGAGQ